MILSLTQSVTAIGPNIMASFLALGGIPAYTYSVVPGGAGGTINSSTGVYTAPNAVASDPVKLFDTIKVVDSLAAIAMAQVLVDTPLGLFCEIIQHELGLANGRVYLWDQKIMQPTDSDLYVAISVPSCKPFGNINEAAVNGIDQNQFASMAATLDVDIISRGPSARDRKEEVILALNSTYARQQQDTNSFFIGKISTSFLNLSQVDGAAIPYRYRISVTVQYAFSLTKASQYFDTFSNVNIVTNA